MDWKSWVQLMEGWCSGLSLLLPTPQAVAPVQMWEKSPTANIAQKPRKLPVPDPVVPQAQGCQPLF